MATYSVTQAKTKFSQLIDAASCGEEVVITRRGKPVVKMHVIAAAPIARSSPEAARKRVENALAHLDLRGLKFEMTTDELMAMTRGED